MHRNRIEDNDFRDISHITGVPAYEVKKIVYSFFGNIVSEARALPFNNASRIYTKERFEDFVKIHNIPSIGRIGPVYSRYLKWRENESKNQIQVSRSEYRAGIPQDDIEHIAAEILSGNTPAPVQKKKATERFNRIWMIGKAGKRMARQVVPKEEKQNGIQD